MQNICGIAIIVQICANSCDMPARFVKASYKLNWRQKLLATVSLYELLILF